MNAFSISFDPVIDPASEPATTDWIDEIDWVSVWDRDDPTTHYNIVFHVHGRSLFYRPQSIVGVLNDLVLIQDGVCWGAEELQAIEGKDVFLIAKSDDGVQFSIPVGWQRSPTTLALPIEASPIGYPINGDAVDLVLRRAIAAVWRRFEAVSTGQ